ncbi:efflux transporter outer membrane subunit [Gramella sp. GC03-9]|uniref:Efflux transporter outer membrane subunit n=1 Tax=Christiangramia oceanisediminis TaxID=2920386 RepID=A0A9X2L016_9FLAO|nr:efflux transporter outer membrane subunit [Gramella oceanisediminis]MCP9201364.1 efflux transporter outer membrane subunit [Gramella oceanisediminis]
MEAPIENPQQFSNSGNRDLPDTWWTSFDDPALHSIIERSLENNLSLAANQQGFLAAMAVVKREKSFLIPDISAEARSGISRPEPDFAGGENTQIGLSASYEVDLWGRIRAGIEAEEYRAQASYYDYQAAAISISAETALTYYRLVAARQQLQLAENQIQTNEEITRLIRARFTGGQIRAVDILRQEQLLQNTREQKVIYETDIEILKNQLALLLAKPAQNELMVKTDSFPRLPELPQTGLPLELVRRRPDVKQAYNLVLAADRDMAVAIRNKYPRLSLNLQGQARSNNFNNIFNDWAYTLSGNLFAPLITGGRLKAEVSRTEAVKEQVLLQYGQTVLTSFREVEDALIREEKQKERIQILEDRLELSQKTIRQLRTEFLNGLSEYLDVLLALGEQQQLQRDLITARQNLIEIRISLYRALAGGLELEEVEEPQFN